MRLLTLIVGMSLLASCAKKDFNIVNLNGGKVITQGHGGMGIHSTYPLNSAASVLECLASGADGVEIDVQMSRDSVLIAYHSADLADATDMSGAVVSRSWAELESARYIGVPYGDHHLMRLDHLLDRLDEPSRFYWTFDLKVEPDGEEDPLYMDRLARAVARLLQGRGLTGQVFLESQRTYLLDALRLRIPGAQLFLYPPDFETGFTIANRLDLKGITIDMAKIGAAQVQLAHDSGLWVSLWNVESCAQNEDALRRSPEIVQSDRVGHLVGLLE